MTGTVVMALFNDQHSDTHVHICGHSMQLYTIASSTSILISMVLPITVQKLQQSFQFQWKQSIERCVEQCIIVMHILRRFQ